MIASGARPRHTAPNRDTTQTTTRPNYHMTQTAPWDRPLLSASALLLASCSGTMPWQHALASCPGIMPWLGLALFPSPLRSRRPLPSRSAGAPYGCAPGRQEAAQGDELNVADVRAAVQDAAQRDGHPQEVRARRSIT
eukprot:5187381-Prymnesium_polylepis.1